MNTVYYRPDQIDWLDGFNPLRRRLRRTNRYNLRSLQAPAMVELRAALEAGTHGIEIVTAPDNTLLSIPAGTTYVLTAQLPAGSWIYGVSGYSQQPEGYLGQVTLPSGSNLFGKPFTSANLAAGPLYCPTPLGLPDGGSVAIRIQNLSINPNAAQLSLWVLEPNQ